MPDTAIASIQGFIESKSIDTGAAGWKTRLPLPAPVAFDAGSKYVWTLATNKGEMKFELMAGIAPMHATSTIYLSLLGYYDGLSFHRVIDGFMAQGGCPHGSGTGGPGYQYDGEFSPEARHEGRGLLSMANAGPGTDGSQFFITFTATPHLDGNHTIFGGIVSGAEVLDAIEACGSRSGKTSEDVLIEKATVAVE